MYLALSEFLVSLSGNSIVWAISVVAAMAVTAVVLYFFWDLVWRGVSLAGRAIGSRRQN
jgi:uncharacterized membrane protein